VNSSNEWRKLSYMVLDVRRMRVLREVALRGTIAAAADALGFTPSALSQQLSSLEREAGAPVLERTGRGVRLTEEGRVLVRHAETILAELEKAEVELEATRVHVGGRLRVAAFSSVTSAVLAPTVARLSVLHPDLEVMIGESDPGEALRDLRLGELDLVVAHEYDHLLVPPDAEINRCDLFVEDMLVAAPPGRFPVGRPVALSELASDVWAAAPTRTDCGTAVREACRAAGFEPDVRYEFTEFAVVLHLVAAGMAVGLLPQLAFTEPTHGYTVHPVSEGGFRRRIFAASRIGNRERPAVVAFLAAVVEASEEFQRSVTEATGSLHAV
jgi:molybdate transport repressor ModE-like protein